MSGCFYKHVPQILRNLEEYDDGVRFAFRYLVPVKVEPPDDLFPARGGDRG
jgi:hypothetical protein